jgi:hypothetical protein
MLSEFLPRRLKLESLDSGGKCHPTFLGSERMNGAAGAEAGGAQGSFRPQTREKRKMARLPDLIPETLSPEQKKVYDAILAGPRGVVQGPLRVWLNSPELASRAQELGAFCRYHSSLPKRLSELAILITGAHWKAGFEWYVHAPEGLKAGLDPAIVEDIRTGCFSNGRSFTHGFDFVAEDLYAYGPFIFEDIQLLDAFGRITDQAF